MLDIIKELRSTNSSTEKIQILKKYKDNELLKKILFYTHNNFYQYYVKKLWDRKLVFILLDLWDIFDLLDQLKARTLSGHEALYTIKNVMDQLSDDDAEVFELILNRNLKCGISESTINKVWPDLIPTFKVQLASGEKDINKIKYPAICQLKGDGRRNIAFVYSDKKKVEYYTRSGKQDLKLNGAIDIDILNLDFVGDWVLDGELIMVNEDGSHYPRRISNGILARKEITPEDYEKVVFLVWDMVPLNSFTAKFDSMPYHIRFDTLKNMVYENPSKHIKLIDSTVVVSLNAAKNIANDYIKNGFEGAILKNMNAPYEAKRTKNMIKIKAEREADLVVTGLIEGTGIMKGYMGALTCETSDGELTVNVGTGFSHEQRGFRIVNTNTMETERLDTEFDDRVIGKIVTIKYNEIIQDAAGNYSLFLPVFIEIRDDKQVADSLDKIMKEV